MTITLCAIFDIPDPGSKGFEVSHNGESFDIFVVHKDEEFHAFINRCPHTGINLEWQEDQFLDLDNAFIQCASHGALFEIDSGLCVHGPCAGDKLSTVALDIVNNQLMITL